MAHHKAALKSIRQTAKRTERNRTLLSRIRTFIRKVEEAISAGKRTEAQEVFRAMESHLMRGRQKNLIHRNTVARKSSRLKARIKALQG